MLFWIIVAAVIYFVLLAAVLVFFMAVGRINDRWERVFNESQGAYDGEWRRAA